MNWIKHCKNGRLVIQQKINFYCSSNSAIAATLEEINEPEQVLEEGKLGMLV